MTIHAMGYEIEQATRTANGLRVDTFFVYLPRQPGEGREYMGRVVSVDDVVDRGVGSYPHTEAHVVRIVVRAGLAGLAS